MKVLITGGSGLIGVKVTSLLQEQGIEVVHLTRSKNSKSGVKTYEWNWENGTIDKNCLTGVSHIIHLAGSGIADKSWTMKRKRELIKSRVETARLLYKIVEEENHSLEAFISASGIGYYGAITNDKIYREEDEPHNDFIAKCCIYWEEAADLFNNNCRVVKLRTGMVLDKNQGGLPKISRSINLGLGAPLGTGNQFVPWIHINDIAQLYLYALKNNIEGSFNAIASQHISNKELTFAIAKTLNKKIRFKRIPSIVIKGVYGELSGIVLEGSRVDNKKIIDTGFNFKYNSIDSALSAIYTL